MLALSDAQMEAVMTAAADLSVEKRSAFLERVAARLKLRDPRHRSRMPISARRCTWR
jgi:hypothetical protein